MIRLLVSAFLLLSIAPCYAAIDFINTSNQYLHITAPVTGTPFTICAWAQRHDNGDHTLAFLSDTGSDTDYFALYFDNNAPQPLFISANDGTASSTSVGSTSTSTWYHTCIVATSATSRDVYLDGSAGTTDTTSKTPANIGTLTLGRWNTLTTNSTDDLDGYLAEVGVWDVALSSSQISELYNSGNGLDARCVGSPIRYWPLADNTDLTDLVTGTETLTAVNSPGNATHPFSPIPGCGGNPFIWLQLVK